MAAAAARGENMDELPEEVRLFLLQHPTLQPIAGNKVRFAVTGHELPCRLSDLQNFTDGRKYKRLSSRPLAFHYSSFEPHIVPSTKNGQLFCKLTLRHINKVPEHVQRHVQGKRYLRALHRYEECQKQGVEYVPACLQNKKKQRHLEEDKGEVCERSPGEDSESGDSMSDLYPDHMFSKRSAAEEEKGSRQSASDEEMEVEGSAPRNPSRKRPQKQAGSSQKKFKSHHKKSKTSKKLSAPSTC
ncbi:surfeit locus protein 2 [Rhinoderma darwinii]|uniref:surfeit locus protein 2 n=1 Tax=Rhinoderma darwinii TaxID=43563 RepID=UPI003F664A57